MTPVFNVGDVVRVKNPDRYLSAFASRIKDRDAIVRGHLLTSFGMRCTLEFQKRNGRGKVFIENMMESALVLVRKSSDVNETLQRLPAPIIPSQIKEDKSQEVTS